MFVIFFDLCVSIWISVLGGGCTGCPSCRAVDDKIDMEGNTERWLGTGSVQYLHDNWHDLLILWNYDY